MLYNLQKYSSLNNRFSGAVDTRYYVSCQETGDLTMCMCAFVILKTGLIDILQLIPCADNT